MNKPNYYGIITAEVRYSKKINFQEKVLFTEITALTNKHGYCFASNGHLAELYDVSTRTIQRWIHNLHINGFIKINLKYKDNSKEVERREIYVVTNVSLGGDNSVIIPGVKSVVDNNTSNNTITPYKKFISELKSQAPKPSKVTATKEGEKLFKQIVDHQSLINDYIAYQEEKKEFAVRITAYMEDYLAKPTITQGESYGF